MRSNGIEIKSVNEYANLAAFPVTGVSNTIYTAIDTGIIYRWSGSVYVVLSANLADAAWTAWTPTLTNITLGNGALNCKYKVIGKTVFFRFQLVLGSTSAIGTNPQFTNPVTSVAVPSSFVRCGAGEAITAAPAIYPAVVLWSNPTAFTFFSQTAPYASITATAPFTWGNGCILAAHGFYEIP
jgi:hypothetical protein